MEENIRFEIQLPCSSNTCLTHEPNATESSCVGHTPRTLWLQVCPPGECGIIDSDCSIIGLATEGFWFD
uniref:Uncharacterized protein n=1 Tax=Arundo donax TaxID=35708 RepID=A0A0A9F8Y2_ARUDO